MHSNRRNTFARRSFLTTVPTCAALCLAGHKLFADPERDEDGVQAAGQASPATHPFDEEVPGKMTWRRRVAMTTAEPIELALFLSKTLGREKSVELLKAFAIDAERDSGREAQERLGGNGFDVLKKQMSPQRLKAFMTTEVTESSAAVHELKVTECLFAKCWRDAGAAEEGFALACYRDYGWIRSFNPKIELVRDKTLMQGHASCNFRYVWRG